MFRKYGHVACAEGRAVVFLLAGDDALECDKIRIRVSGGRVLVSVSKERMPEVPFQKLLV